MKIKTNQSFLNSLKKFSLIVLALAHTVPALAFDHPNCIINLTPVKKSSIFDNEQYEFLIKTLKTSGMEVVDSPDTALPSQYLAIKITQSATEGVDFALYEKSVNGAFQEIWGRDYDTTRFHSRTLSALLVDLFLRLEACHSDTITVLPE